MKDKPPAAARNSIIPFLSPPLGHRSWPETKVELPSFRYGRRFASFTLGRYGTESTDGNQSGSLSSPILAVRGMEACALSLSLPHIEWEGTAIADGSEIYTVAFIVGRARDTGARIGG